MPKWNRTLTRTEVLEAVTDYLRKKGDISNNETVTSNSVGSIRVDVMEPEPEPEPEPDNPAEVVVTNA